MAPKSMQHLLAPLHPLALWFWKVLPLPARVRRAYLELTHPRFLIGVMALIRDEQQRVLILEHTYRRAFPWGLPGGYLQTREEPTEGLARELYEETGLVVEVDDLLVAGLYTPFQLDLLYRARIVGGQIHATAEVSDWRFVPELELAGILPNQLSMLVKSGAVGLPDDLRQALERNLRAVPR
jgi:8-oxo-dGTP pyrophosphatase MutT (NUDIX family)